MKDKSKKIVVPEYCISSGVIIKYIKSRDAIVISGFYDNHTVSIESTEMSVKDFAERLGIDLAKKR